jgi:hypothetical protein
LGGAVVGRGGRRRARVAARCAASANDLSPDGADGLDRLRRLLAERAAGLREGELHGPA